MLYGNSPVEMWRTDFSTQFLINIVEQIQHGHDPRNYIGLQCGVNMPRATQIYCDRVFAGTD